MRADRSRFASSSCTLSLLCADFIAIITSVALVAWCRGLIYGEFTIQTLPGGLPALREIAVLFVVLIGYLAVQGRYSNRIPFWTEAKVVFCASACAVAAELTVALLNSDLASRMPGVAVLALFPVCALLANRLTKNVLSQIGVWALPIVVIGDGPGAAAAEAALKSDRSLGYEIVGRVDPSTAMAASGPRLLPLLDRYNGSSLLLALDGDQAVQRDVIDCALRERVPFAIAPQPHVLPSCAWEATRLFSQDAVLLSFRPGLSRRVPRIVKSVIDMSVAAILLVVTSPIFLIVALLGRLEGGPIFFAHRRVGAEGRAFYCLKFRTMVVDADRVLKETLANNPAQAAEWEATQKLSDDPRITAIGKILRKTSLDELPQLINVLRREMSLVGPRPIVESEVRFYGDDIAHYYGARPGVTGLWQVSGRSNTSYARRVQLDVWYVTNWTVWLDITVLLKTLPAVLRREGAR
jgi:Undecaprenyl-phosphate galactose phosphotransferase WbaP